MGDGATTGEKTGSGVGEGDLEECLEALGFDLDRNERDDNLSVGNGGVIFSSASVGLNLSAGAVIWKGFAVFREFAGSCNLNVPVSPVFLLCLRLDNDMEREKSEGGFLAALLLLLLINPSNTGIVSSCFFVMQQQAGPAAFWSLDSCCRPMT